MAKLIVSNLVSLDGYCAGPGGNLGVLPMDAAFNAYNAERLRSAGTLLLGRTTFSMFSAYWPMVADDASASPVLRETARLNAAMNKVVVSDTVRLDAAAPWGNAEVVVRRQAHARISENQGGHAARCPRFRQPCIVERPSGPWPDRRAAPLDGPGGAWRRCAGIRARLRCAAAPLRLTVERRLPGSDTVLLQYSCGSPA